MSTGNRRDDPVQVTKNAAMDDRNGKNVRFGQILGGSSHVKRPQYLIHQHVTCFFALLDVVHLTSNAAVTECDNREIEPRSPRRERDGTGLAAAH
jgi:hypothetical protein